MASTFKIILAVGGIFMAGAVTGGFVSVRVLEHMARQKQVQRVGPTEMSARLAEQLKLTPEQKEKVHPIISQTVEELRKVRKDAFSQTAALMAKMDADLAQELTEEQRVLLKEVRIQEEERRKRWSAERAKRSEGRSGDGAEGSAHPPGPPPSR